MTIQRDESSFGPWAVTEIDFVTPLTPREKEELVQSGGNLFVDVN